MAQLLVSNIWNNRLPRMIAFPQIVCPFLSEQRNNRPLLIFEDILKN